MCSKASCERGGTQTHTHTDARRRRGLRCRRRAHAPACVGENSAAAQRARCTVTAREERPRREPPVGDAVADAVVKVSVTAPRSRWLARERTGVPFAWGWGCPCATWCDKCAEPSSKRSARAQGATKCVPGGMARAGFEAQSESSAQALDVAAVPRARLLKGRAPHARRPLTAREEIERQSARVTELARDTRRAAPAREERSRIARHRARAHTPTREMSATSVSSFAGSRSAAFRANAGLARRQPVRACVEASARRERRGLRRGEQPAACQSAATRGSRGLGAARGLVRVTAT